MRKTQWQIDNPVCVHEEVVPVVSGAAITIIARNNYGELTAGQLEMIAHERQRANLYRRYGTDNPDSIRDYWFPKKDTKS